MSDIAKMFFLAKAACSGSSAPAPTEVVILPETELEPAEVEPGSYGTYVLTTPLAATPTGGAMCEVTWGGTKYVSKVVDISALVGAPAFALGNLALAFGGEIPEGIPLENPVPSAPYVLQIVPGGQDVGGNIVYAIMMSQGITPDPPVLSIVQTEGGATTDGNSDFVLKAVETDDGIVSEQKWSEVVSAVIAGKRVRMIITISTLDYESYLFTTIRSEGTLAGLYFFTASILTNEIARYGVGPGDDDSITVELMQSINPD